MSSWDKGIAGLDLGVVVLDLGLVDIDLVASACYEKPWFSCFL